MKKDIREEDQEEVVDMYLLANKMRTTLILATGFGKSKVAIELLTKLAPSHIYIVVNSTDLRDNEWKKEFKKHGRGALLENYVSLVTYQYLSRNLYTPEEVDENSLILLDEVDFMADTPILSRVLSLFEGIRTIGLTGFVTESKKNWFAENLPVLVTLSADDAQKKGILNKLKFVFIKYNLSLDPNDVTVTYKKHGHDHTFTQSENASYEYQQNRYIHLLAAKQVWQTQFTKGEINYDSYEKGIKDYDYKITYAVKERGEILLHAKSSVNMARKLLTHIETTSPNSKTIVFSKRTLQSEKVCGMDRVYNGSIDKKLAKKHYDAFNEGTLRVLGTCDKLNRGVNVDNLDVALFETFYGSDTQAVQRFGRMMRLDPDKEATIYVLLPYYMREDANKIYSVQPTQQVDWANKMLRSTNVTNSSVWDYRQAQEHNTN